MRCLLGGSHRSACLYSSYAPEMSLRSAQHACPANQSVVYTYNSMPHAPSSIGMPDNGPYKYIHITDTPQNTSSLSRMLHNTTFSSASRPLPYYLPQRISYQAQHAAIIHSIPVCIRIGFAIPDDSKRSRSLLCTALDNNLIPTDIQA